MTINAIFFSSGFANKDSEIGRSDEEPDQRRFFTNLNQHLNHFSGATNGR